MKMLRLISVSVFVLLAVFFSAAPAFSDVYVYKDRQGVLTFTNVPAHTGYRRVIRESNGQVSVAGGSRKFGAPGNYEELIRFASDRYSIDAYLVKTVIKV